MKDKIRIENGRIIGLGTSGEESISVMALDKFFECIPAKDAAEFLEKTAKDIGMIAMYFHEVNQMISLDSLECEILSMLPDMNGMFWLYEMAKFFKS